MNTVMQCGCRANARTRDGKPCCAIHVGLHPGYNKPMEVQPALTGRRARCNCGRSADSSASLPFFEYRPDQEYDGYYCGCLGWD